MTDRDPSVPGGPASGPDEAPLLFDPNSADPADDLARASGGDPGSGGNAILYGAVGAAVVVIGVAGFLLTRGAEGAAGPDELPVAPVTTVRGPRIEVVPDSVVPAEVGTSVMLTFRVAGPAGAPQASFPLTYSVASGDGALESASGVTDSLGIARLGVSLSDRPGSTVVTATSASGPSRPGRATIVASVGLPDVIRIAAGNGQDAPAGELLPERVAVVVSDAAGNPVPNVEVRFRVEMGEGLTAPSLTRTDSTGQASALWRLGRMEGRQELAAISADLLTSVTFVATARPLGSAEDDEDRPPEGAAVRVSAVRTAVGGSHVCSIEDDLVACRGSNDRGQLAADGSGRLIAVTAGASHACGLDEAGRAVCWGGNERGQIGDGSRNDRGEVTAVRSELRFSVLSAGAAHTCGLAGSGVPFCWGHNLNGQLGDGSRNDQTAPRTVGGGLQFRTIVSGWDHTCGLTSNGNAFCWGLNSQGQLGDGGTLDRLVPTLVRGAVETMVAGSAHTCGVSDGEILCWGANNFGQLGDGTTENRLAPVPVGGLPDRPIHLAAGAVHTCALVQGGRAYCWGQNLQGQLGDGTTQNRPSPVAVTGALSFRALYAGGAVTCGVTTAGEEYCWGLNQSGQLGDGTRDSRSTPTRVQR